MCKVCESAGTVERAANRLTQALSDHMTIHTIYREPPGEVPSEWLDMLKKISGDSVNKPGRLHDL